MTNPAVFLNAADDQRSFCLYFFSEPEPIDLAKNHRRSCSFEKLGNDPLGLRTPSDGRIPLSTDPNDGPTTNRAVPLAVADGQRPFCR